MYRNNLGLEFDEQYNTTDGRSLYYEIIKVEQFYFENDYKLLGQLFKNSENNNEDKGDEDDGNYGEIRITNIDRRPNKKIVARKCYYCFENTIKNTNTGYNFSIFIMNMFANSYNSKTVRDISYLFMLDGGAKLLFYDYLIYVFYKYYSKWKRKQRKYIKYSAQEKRFDYMGNI